MDTLQENYKINNFTKFTPAVTRKWYSNADDVIIQGGPTYIFDGNIWMHS